MDYPSLLNSSQIEQLNELRSKVDMKEVCQYPRIRISGKEMLNLVPGAGMFTAKIQRKGELVNLVVMLADTGCLSQFERLCMAYGSLPKDFWAQGYVLPSRAGVCYSVLLVTSFRFCGHTVC